MNRIHVFTTVGLIFVFTGIALMPSELPLLAAVYALTGYLFSIKEVSKYTSRYQFSTVFFAAIILGISLDKNWQHLPLLTIAVALSAGGTILRIVFFRTFGYARYTWFEPLMFVLAVLFYFSGNIVSSNGWQGWAFPAVMIYFQGLFTLGILKDKKQLLGFTGSGSKISISKEAPDFELPDQDGNMVSLMEYHSKRNLLLIFVRGDWCPGCHMMLTK